MSSTQQLEKILNRLDEQRDDTWGKHARVVADGIRESGLGSSLQHSVTVLADTWRHYDHEVGAKVSLSNTYLAGIQRSLAMPRGTAAGERQERGLTALARGWTQEAITELTVAVELNPYDYRSQHALAVALTGTSQIQDAARHFCLSARYAEDRDVAAVVDGALMSARLWLALDMPSEAIEVLQAAVYRVPDCVEILVMLARLTNESRWINDSLEIDPELAVMMMALNIDGVEHACSTLIADTTSTVNRVRRAAEAQRVLHGLQGARAIDDDFDTSSDAAIMTSSGRWLRNSLRAAKEESAARIEPTRAPLDTRQIDRLKSELEDRRKWSNNYRIGRIAAVAIALISLGLGINAGVLYAMDQVNAFVFLIISIVGFGVAVMVLAVSRTTFTEPDEDVRAKLHRLEADKLAAERAFDRSLAKWQVVERARADLSQALVNLPPTRTNPSPTD